MSLSLESLKHVSFSTLLVSSLILRIALIKYSEWHDVRSVLKYTDIDYTIFTDAARFLLKPANVTVGAGEGAAQGPLGAVLNVGDPYARATYRYTPLLAVLMIPNTTLHPSFGKYLFSICDLIVGYLIYQLLRSKILPNAYPEASSLEHEKKATLFAALHLWNPMVFSISTRGSSESILGALVIGTLYYAMKSNKSQKTWDCTAIMLGISTHWKIYPLIYGVSLVSVISSEATKKVNDTSSFIKGLLSVRSLRFAMVSFVTFMLLNGAMYLIWGYPFIYETYLYHIHRLDDAHNFSPYWYPIRLARESEDLGTTLLWHRFVRSPFASFIPQMGLSLGFGFLFGRAGAQHLPFTWFAQTVAFVTFNKVCTSQYFLWYLTILPLVLPFFDVTWKKAVSIIAVWAGAQALWLKFAYDLEFLGKDVAPIVWGFSVVFLVVNCWALSELVRAYRWERPLIDGEKKSM